MPCGNWIVHYHKSTSELPRFPLNSLTLSKLYRVDFFMATTKTNLLHHHGEKEEKIMRKVLIIFLFFFFLSPFFSVAFLIRKEIFPRRCREVSLLSKFSRNAIFFWQLKINFFLFLQRTCNFFRSLSQETVEPFVSTVTCISIDQNQKLVQKYFL